MARCGRRCGQGRALDIADIAVAARLAPDPTIRVLERVEILAEQQLVELLGRPVRGAADGGGGGCAAQADGRRVPAGGRQAFQGAGGQVGPGQGVAGIGPAHGKRACSMANRARMACASPPLENPGRAFGFQAKMSK